MKIPYVYLSFCQHNQAYGRWDQAWVQRILNAEEWKVPGGVEFEEATWELNGRGAVIIFPAGHYYEHCSMWGALARLQKLVNSMTWSVVIATSDERSTFPWSRFVKPENCRLWVMTPRPEKVYPEGTFFIGEGSPTSPEQIYEYISEDWDKLEDLYFIGQANHERRWQMLSAVQDLRCNWTADQTGGFKQGLRKPDYFRLMGQARCVPCPSGRSTQDSFRFYEALEAQSIPIADLRRPRTKGNHGRYPVPLYWKMLFDTSPVPAVLDWGEELSYIVEEVIPNDLTLPARVSAWWQQQKRRVAYKLQKDVREARQWHGVSDIDRVTVLMVTSPSPLHPSTNMIVDTINSVRTRLPNAEILIGIDGLRAQDEDRADIYYEYARRLCAEVNPLRNVCPFVFDEHAHQSGMVNRLLDEVHTDHVLFMEHDAPLTGEIDFDECVQMMDRHDLGLLRFHYDHDVHPEHAYLYLETSSTTEAPFVRTTQYSARPHLIRTDLLREWVATYFGSKSKTFLEDTLHGALQYLPARELWDDERAHLEAVWEQHRMAVYAPNGSWKRSLHSDGRRGDPKLPTWIEYDGPVPPWSPAEGELIV